MVFPSDGFHGEVAASCSLWPCHAALTSVQCKLSPRARAVVTRHCSIVSMLDTLKFG